MSEEIDVGAWYRQQRTDYLSVVTSADLIRVGEGSGFAAYHHIFRAIEPHEVEVVLDNFYRCYRSKMCCIGVALRMLTNEVLVSAHNMLLNRVRARLELSNQYVLDFQHHMRNIATALPHVTEVNENTLSGTEIDEERITDLCFRHWSSIIRNSRTNPFHQVVRMVFDLQTEVSEINQNLYQYCDALLRVRLPERLSSNYAILLKIRDGPIFFYDLVYSLTGIAGACSEVERLYFFHRDC